MAIELNYDYSSTQVPDLFSVKGKVALITGGSSGLGLNMAHGLVRNGAKVYISSRKQDQCDAAVKELREFGQAEAITCDASKYQSIKALVDELKRREPGGVHILIANAGATWGADIDNHPDDAFGKVMDLNVRRVFTTTQLMLPLLEKASRKDDPARVIATGSVAGLRVSTAQIIPYSTSKAAVHHMIRNLAVALGPRGITCNAIAPGMFPSKMTRGTLSKSGGMESVVNSNPMGRLGEARDIIGVSLFLCSKAGAYCNGIVVPLDGAAYMQGSKI